MKSYGELKAEIEANQRQVVASTKNERANAIKEEMLLFKELGFTAWMLKGSLTEGRKLKNV